MTEHVSTLAQLHLRGSNFLVIVANESGHSTEIQSKLDKNANLFGNEVGIAARLVRATSRAHINVSRELLEKPWPPEVLNRMRREEDPYLVFITDVDFDEFNPGSHDWRILWLGNARTPGNSIPRFFGILQQAISNGETPFTLLDRVSDEQTGASVYGSITSPHRLQAAALERGPGRPGIMDPGYGIREWIDEQAHQGNLQDRSRGWRIRLVDRLIQEKPNLPGNRKSVRDAITRAGLFAELQNKQ